MPKRILVIDDSEVMLKMLVKSLRDAGYEARGTVDLVRFGRHIQEYQPDLILADVMMPNVDGDQVCRDLKAELGGRKVPVYLISSMAEGELHQRAVSSGADGYISKRDGFRKVMEQIERVLSGEQVSKWKMKA